MKKLYILMAALWGFHLSGMAEEPAESPKGKAIIRVFTNFHTGFGNHNHQRGFELNRSYLGYQYDLTKELQIKAVMDVGQSDDVNDFHRIAYIKNAQLTWSKDKLTLNGGMISTIQFGMQEKFWGYRYIMMSFQDQYKFGSSADLGVSAAYQLTDWLSADAIVVNGEGYKKVQIHDGLQYGIGATIQPLKGLYLRVYGSLNEGGEEVDENITNVATFIGYKNRSFSIAAEYNWMSNAGYVKEADRYGYSVYGTVKLSDKTEVYARYDQISSKDDWNEAKDESMVMAGVQIKLGKYVKLAPNLRMNMPKLKGADDRYMGYISCFFGF